MSGWSWAWHAELEPFPAAVLAARHPGSVNLGDVLAPGFDDRAKAFGPIDVLVGGPPCQAFSIAGNRNSLSDPRGNLSLRWAQIIHAIKPVFAVTENVPGWLNTPDNAFGHFLGALVGADDPLPAPGGQGWPRAGMVAGPLARACWRVLDAQYFDLAQRRERVFIVSSAGDWTDPSQILFEPKSLRRDTPTRGEARQRIARPLSAGSPRGSGYRNDADTADNLITAYGGNDTRGPIEVSTALNAHGGPHGRLGFESETFVATAYRTSGNQGCYETGDRTDALTTSTDPFSHVVAFAENSRAEVRLEGGDGQTVSSLKTGGGKPGQSYPAIAVDLQNCALGGEVSGTLDTTRPTRGGGQAVMAAAIRRLLPVECEKLQGFWPGYTAITYRGKEAADGPRYKSLGNSMAVPVLTWLLTRIEAQMTSTEQIETAA